MNTLNPPTAPAENEEQPPQARRDGRPATKIYECERFELEVPEDDAEYDAFMTNFINVASDNQEALQRTNVKSRSLTTTVRDDGNAAFCHYTQRVAGSINCSELRTRSLFSYERRMRSGKSHVPPPRKREGKWSGRRRNLRGVLGMLNRLLRILHCPMYVCLTRVAIRRTASFSPLLSFVRKRGGLGLRQSEISFMTRTVPAAFISAARTLRTRKRIAAGDCCNPIGSQRGSRRSVESGRCHCRRRLGTLQPGKTADLILVAGDPSKDISAMRQIRAVMQNGRWVKQLGEHEVEGK